MARVDLLEVSHMEPKSAANRNDFETLDPRLCFRHRSHLRIPLRPGRGILAGESLSLDISHNSCREYYGGGSVAKRS
jgi:hypothetical protein